MDTSKSEKREKALLALSKDPFRIVKGNPLVEARYELTPLQSKLFIFLLSKLDTTKDSFEPMVVVIKDFQQFVGLKGDSLYSHLKAETKKMLNKKVFYKDDKMELNSNLISACVYLDNEGAILIEFPMLLKPYLLQLKDNFTIIDIRNLLGLDSFYSMRFYELCQEKERFKSFEMSVEDIKNMFAIENKYKNYYDFKMKVLVRAREELKENSELYFNFEEIKEGRKIVTIKFHVIKSKRKLRRQDQDVMQLEDSFFIDEINEIHNLVSDYISQATVQSWFEKYPYDQIKRGVLYVLHQNEKGGVKEVGAYLQKMVAMKDLFDADQVKKDQAKKKKAEKEQKAEGSQKIQQQIDQMKHQAHEHKLSLFTKLIQEDETAQETIVAKLKNGVFKSYYKDALDLVQNLENPALAGILVGIAQDLYPGAFESMKAIEQEISELSKSQH